MVWAVPFLYLMEKGADLVAKALLGMESRTIVVAGVPYFVKPFTVKQIAGIGLSLSGTDVACHSVKEMLEMMMNADGAAKALSYAVKGDKSLYETFLQAPFSQVIQALEDCFSLMGIRDFQKLSDLSRSVRSLIANQK